MQKFNAIIENFTDSRIFNKVFLPLTIYNIIYSFIIFYKEKKLLETVINENSDFFKALATLNFRPNIFGLVSVMPYEPQMTIEDIYDIANKTVIGIILKYVNDENLLGIVYVDCKLVKTNVVTAINPVSLKLLIVDLYDMIWSASITIIVIISALCII
jgi:hypothetical protein